MNLFTKINLVTVILSVFSLNGYAAEPTLICDLTALRAYPGLHARVFAAARQWVIRTSNLNFLNKNASNVSVEQVKARTPLADCLELASTDTQFRSQEFGEVGIVKYPEQECVALKVQESAGESLLIVYPLTTLIYDLQSQQLMIFNDNTKDFEPVDPRSRRGFSYTIFQIKQDLGVQ